MRSYSSLLVFETVFDSIPEDNSLLSILAKQVFNPTLKVVEHSCHTLLGETIDLNFEAEGRIELATGEFLTRDRITYLLSQGIYQIQIRTLSTCISEGGVCATCYASMHPLEPFPAVGSLIEIDPLFDKSSEVIVTSATESTFTLSLPDTDYTKTLIFIQGEALDPSEYTVVGSTLTLSTAVPTDTFIVVRYQSITHAPYMLWLAGTYSGSLLGVKQLPGPLLPIPASHIIENIDSSLVELLLEESKSVSSIPPNMIEYAAKVQDLLEKALFLIALRVIYNNVSN